MADDKGEEYCPECGNWGRKKWRHTSVTQYYECILGHQWDVNNDEE